MVNVVAHMVTGDSSSERVSGNQKNSEAIERFFVELEIEQPKRYSPEQLQIFTSNFSKSLGSGSCGQVYKGILYDGVHVAVKILKERLLSDDIQDQFKAEVSILGKTHHRNLVKLYGFCFESKMKALVYEFMENESLDKVLYENQSIRWETLYNIAIGIAYGLSYLHKDCQPTIIHCDIKPSNILLDSDFSPKVGDFGLAKLLNGDITHVTLSGFQGTPYYGAPELWMPFSAATHKCDVYSYGIMMFEMVGRRRHHLGQSQKWFPRQVWEKFEKEQEDEFMADCGIQEMDREQAKRISMIALWCVQYAPYDRPSMSHVVRLLEGREEVDMPPNPFWYLDSSGMARPGRSTRKKLSPIQASSSVIHTLAQNSGVDMNHREFYIGWLFENLKATKMRDYLGNLKATMKREYFSDPWSVLSFISAGLLLILTIIQTVYSIIYL